MTHARFSQSFTQQRPIVDEGIGAANAAMRSGRLHSDITKVGEVSETAKLEREYTEWQGSAFCFAVASGRQAMQIALRAAGVVPDDLVLMNGRALAQVPEAIAAVGGLAVLVEMTCDLVICLYDLAATARHGDAQVLLLWHMRGHLCDMDGLAQIAADLKLMAVEECAHTMGASWNDRLSGSFGKAARFSTQTYKHMTSDKGGLLTTDDTDFRARPTMLSGSYVLCDWHGAVPSVAVSDSIRLEPPKTSARTTNLRAAQSRPQLRSVAQNIAAWNAQHDLVVQRRATSAAIDLPQRPKAEQYVGSSVQFCLPSVSHTDAAQPSDQPSAVDAKVKGFGAVKPAGFTSDHHIWQVVTKRDLPKTDAILAGLFDTELPLTLSLEACILVSDHVLDTVDAFTVKAQA